MESKVKNYWIARRFIPSIKPTKAGALFLIFVVVFGTLIWDVRADTGLQRRRKQGSGTGTTISDVTLLLPLVPSKPTLPVRYKLEAYNGCFRWTSMNTEIVRVEPIPNPTNAKCSTSAWVEVVDHSLTQRSSTWIVAHDINVGVELRCEVFLDFIDKIEILTTTQVIYKEHSELIEVLAYDSQKNTFSTVEGLHFRWEIEQSSAILKTVAFKDSNLEISSSIRTLELEGKQSNAILVEGVELGKVKLSAKLIEEYYDKKQVTSLVHLIVMESMYLDPSQTIWIAPGTDVQYVLNSQGRDKVPTRVDLRVRKFLWKLTDLQPAYCSQLEDYWLVEAKELGKTTLSITHPQDRKSVV